jgi:hypothetical protein
MFNTGKMVLCLALGSLLSVQGTASAMANGTPQIVATMLNGQMSLLVLSPSQAGVDKTGHVALAGLSQNSSEFKSYWDGASFFCGSPKDGTGYQKFGDRAYQKMEYKGKSAELNSFQQQGERWTCVIDGILYQEVNGKAVPLAGCEFRTYMADNGQQRRAQMCKRTNEASWCFAGPEGNVYLQEPSGKIRQIGRMAWRVAPLSAGEKVLMLMTQGMDKGAKWTGRYAGKSYRDK